MPKVLNEDGSTYIFQPQSLIPYIKKVKAEQAIRRPHGPLYILVPWDPGGRIGNSPLEVTFLRQATQALKETFNKLLASNYKPP
jgi:hypothetical protein